MANLPCEAHRPRDQSEDPMRSFLVGVLDDSKSDHENRNLAIRLLLRLGQAYESVEMIACSVLYTLKFEIDISKELESWYSLPEVYSHDESVNVDDIDFDDKPDVTQLCKKVEFGSDPLVS